MNIRIRGALAPVLTPFTRGLEPDVKNFVAHSRWLVDNNAGLAIFGTNSEAASLSVAERLHLTDALFEAGIPAAKMMPGTGVCSLIDAVTLTRHAVQSAVAGVLMLPPFFYKGVTEDGVFAYYSEVIERIGDARLSIYLYHIPQMTQVPITLNLIERLLKRYPQAIAGAKDSSGDWGNTKAMIDSFGRDGFDVFPASESLLSKALAIGGAGCISATVNVNPAAITQLFSGWNGPEGADLQAAADVIRQIFQATAMVPAMKYVIADATRDESWRTVRPPLCPLTEDVAADLTGRLRAAKFAVTGHPGR